MQRQQQQQQHQFNLHCSEPAARLLEAAPATAPAPAPAAVAIIVVIVAVAVAAAVVVADNFLITLLPTANLYEQSAKSEWEKSYERSEGGGKAANGACQLFYGLLRFAIKPRNVEIFDSFIDHKALRCADTLATLSQAQPKSKRCV